LRDLALVSVHCCPGSFHAARPSSLSETKHIMIPHDQVNLAFTVRRPMIPLHEPIPQLAQMEVSVFLSLGRLIDVTGTL
jgi:hypothetical protein